MENKLTIIIISILLFSTIVFASGSINSDFSITEYLTVGSLTREYPSNAFSPGNINIAGRVSAEKGIRVFPPSYGTSISAFSNHDTISQFSDNTGSITAETQYFCDYVNGFTIENVGDVITTLTPPYAGATGEIKDYVNTSCVRLSFGSSTNGITSASNLDYLLYPHPVAMILDNGYISFNVGNNTDSVYEVHIEDGNGPNGFLVEDSAGMDGHSSATIETDLKSYNAVPLSIFGSSSTGADSISSQFVQIVGDGTGYTNSLLGFMKMDIVGSAGVGNVLYGIQMTPAVQDIITVGSADEINRVYYDNITNIPDITTEATDSGEVNIFTKDDSIIYIGNTLNFTAIGVSLVTDSSANIRAEFYYCNSSEMYEQFIPESDSTAGFTSGGIINVGTLPKRGVCNTEIDGTALADTDKYTYIAIKRTKNNVVTPPKLGTLSITGGSTNFFLRKDMMKLHPVDDAPEACDATTLGSIYFDISEDDMCVCKSTGWKVMTDGSECT